MDKYCWVCGPVQLVVLCTWSGSTVMCRKIKWHWSGMGGWTKVMHFEMWVCRNGKLNDSGMGCKVKWLFTNQHGVTSQKAWIFLVWAIKLCWACMHIWWDYFKWLQHLVAPCEVACVTHPAHSLAHPHTAYGWSYQISVCCLQLLYGFHWSIMHFVLKMCEIQFLQEVSYSCEREHGDVLTEEILEIGARLVTYANRSLTWLAQQTFVSISSAKDETKLLHLHPYNVNMVHELQGTDHDHEFCGLLP
jgi:hypothetical protein